MTIVLDSEQQAIVGHRKGHLQVIACAGSGKTESISQRVAALLAEGILPEQIIASTFTDRAAAGMKARIVARAAERSGRAVLDRIGRLCVGTIHSYCLRLLQEHVPEFASFDILDDNRLAGLLSRERRRLRLDRIGTKHWLPIHEFLENAEAVENELIDPKKLLKTPFGDCYSDYLEMLERYHFLTYGQLITRAVEALEKPAVFKRVHGNLRHLIVDEYQDINPAQERLISLLAREPVQLCVVGDDDQAIYQWRGSQMSNILKFKERYGAARKPLTSNRRSRPKIVRAANAFARSLQPRLPKEMKWITSGWGPEIVCWTAETPEDEAKTIADAITKLHKAGFDYSEMAILLRSVRTSSAPILAALTDCNVPVNCTGRTGLFLQPEAQALGRLYAWLSSNDWKDGRYQEPEHVDLKAVIAALESAFGGVATSKLVRR